MTPEEFRKILAEVIAQHFKEFENRTRERTFYTVKEFAALVEKADHTVRCWCWRKRLNADRMSQQAGPHARYVISRQEYERYLREGLLPG
jgi:hypothetical protein